MVSAGRAHVRGDGCHWGAPGGTFQPAQLLPHPLAHPARHPQGPRHADAGSSPGRGCHHTLHLHSFHDSGSMSQDGMTPRKMNKPGTA